MFGILRFLKRYYHIGRHVYICRTSEDAFAAVIYLRSITNTGANISLVAAKAKLAPIKLLSIPRLELQGAILGTKLLNTVRNELRLPISKIMMWSDSQTVLAWINSDHRKYKQFVAHRIDEILEFTTMDQWKYIPSSKNPADEGTQIVKKSIWFSGPTFLSQKIEKWSKRGTMKYSNEEFRHYVAIHQQNDEFSFIHDDHFSNWWQLVKRISILKKFVDWMKKKLKSIINTKYNDIVCVENALFKKKWECIPEEMAALTNGHDVMRSRNQTDYFNYAP